MSVEIAWGGNWIAQLKPASRARKSPDRDTALEFLNAQQARQMERAGSAREI
ncbi:MAG TPA: hypothetical protein VGZ26_09850 [Pirellulales bacterium]|jgi:hypothetical protein|nr:hypothetical protein [Pirellulales bacterium]